MRKIKVGSRVEWWSKTHTGRGTVAAIVTRKTGDFYTVKTKDHPAGQVAVRASQVQ